MTCCEITDESGSITINVARLKALGEPTRLRIFEFLRSCCRPVAVDEAGDVRTVTGPTVGEVCCQITGVDKITSTISEHLKELKDAGLITIERRGRNMICGVNQYALTELSAYFGSRATQESEDRCCAPDCCATI